MAVVVGNSVTNVDVSSRTGRGRFEIRKSARQGSRSTRIPFGTRGVEQETINGKARLESAVGGFYFGNLTRKLLDFASNAVRQHRRFAQAQLTLAPPSA